MEMLKLESRRQKPEKRHVMNNSDLDAAPN